ncbi:MAG: DUF448 domain-containing protein [Magnetococcales bacterium]|nr:DUF448 domain-containing protein [Magnetococcales bacterium]
MMPGKPDNSTPAEVEVQSDNGTRSCAVTRQHRPRPGLLRFVLDPQGRWMADLAGRLPGRGVSVLPSPVQVRSLLKRRGVGADEMEAILQQVGQGLTARFLDGLGLARRAGCLRRGLRDVSEAVQGGGRPVLLLATDTAVHTRQKVIQLIHRYTLQDVWELLDREQFGLACGNNGPVAVLAVMDVRMGDRVRSDALRWRDFFHPVDEKAGTSRSPQRKDKQQ